MASPSHRGERQIVRELVRTLRSDLNVVSNEAKKKYPAVKEAAERGAMRLKTMSESKGFSLKVLAETDDVIHPLLFACETKNLVICKIALSSLQKLIQHKAVPQKSVESIVATLHLLMLFNVEELKILQTILLLVSVTEVVQGKNLIKVLELCFKLYGSKDSNVHNMAGVTIRQIVSSMFERLDGFMKDDNMDMIGGGVNIEQVLLPAQARDAYLLFQDICFLTNGDPPAWLSSSVDLELPLGLELLEAVLTGYPKVFVMEKLFNQLLTERVCPLIIKLFSPSSKYRHTTGSHSSPVTAALLAADKPTFALSVRLLRILSVLIREFYSYLVTQCEIFLSMLVRFLDSDKPQWQRTLAVEVLFSFCNDPYLLKSFCESYDMQEHSSRIFGDIIDALGSCIQSSFTSQPPPVQLPFGITSSTPSTSTSNSNSGSHVTSAGGMVTSGGQQLHLFNIRGINIQVQVLPKTAHIKPIYLEMLDKTEVPLIVEGYPLVVAMNALFNAIKSVSLVINDKITSRATTPPPTSPASDNVKSVMLKSSWSGVLAALALLLDACIDEQTTKNILAAHTTYVHLCGKLNMTSPRDAFLTSLCKASLPPKYTISLITQHRVSKTQTASTQGSLSHSLTRHPDHVGTIGSTGSEHSSRRPIDQQPTSHTSHTSAPPQHIVTSTVGGQMLSAETEQPSEYGARRKLNLSESLTIPSRGMGNDGQTGGGAGTPTATHRSSSSFNNIAGGSLTTPMKEQQSGWVTVKNLQCITTLLEVIDSHGNILDTAWTLLLTALQHVFDIFGLRPLSNGGFKQSGIADNSSLSLVSIEKKSDISTITDELETLFTSSKKLSEPSVMSMITSLCQLSTNVMNSPLARETGLFPVGGLLDVGTANLSRMSLVWTPITSHITEVCSHSDPTLRVFAAEVLTTLTKTALENTSHQETELVILTPLEGLTRIQFVDVRQKQLECVAHVLQSARESLQSSWSVILDVIRSVTDLQCESLIRTGFQSLQLVITDFLPALPTFCVPVYVEVIGQYGLQKMDINISLTSVGLLWNMADYLFQNKSTLLTSLEALRVQVEETKQSNGKEPPLSPVKRFYKTLGNPSLPVFDSVWLLLFKYLSELCINERAAVRKSACQTLFSTISAHGSLLQSSTWNDVLWQVLFPLLDGVSQATGSASTSSFQTAIMIHHSRDTEQKQWAETQVLVLTGTARLFQSRWQTLTSLSGFEKAWVTFLISLKKCACNTNSEVSIAAIKSFHMIVDPQTMTSSSVFPRNSSTHSSVPLNLDLATITATPFLSTSSGALHSDMLHQERASGGSIEKEEAVVVNFTKEENVVIWNRAWQAWESIGRETICNRLPSVEKVHSALKSSQKESSFNLFHGVPTQLYLTHFLEIFPHIYAHLKSVFTKEKFQVLCQITSVSLKMPISKDVSPFLVPSSNENLMTSVQKLVVEAFGSIFTGEDIFEPREPIKGSLLSNRQSDFVEITNKITLNPDLYPGAVSLYPQIISELLVYFSYTTHPPDKIAATRGIPTQKLPMMSVNFVPFGLGSLSLAIKLYRACVDIQIPLQDHIPEDFLKFLHVPLKLKHCCSTTSAWIHSLDALLIILEICLHSHGELPVTFWRELASVLEDFLFHGSPEGLELPPEKTREFEALDIKVIEMIKKDILVIPTRAPREFLDHLTSILNHGSIHAASDQTDGSGPQSDVPFRENFARVCFEALLQFSFIDSEAPTLSTDSSNQLALKTLLVRSQDVLKKFINDERLSGSCPLPRTRMNEVSLVLKSVTILISALKDAQQNSTNIDGSIWKHVSNLYPALVQCVTCNSQDVRLALREALHQFTDLIKAQNI